MGKAEAKSATKVGREKMKERTMNDIEADALDLVIDYCDDEPLRETARKGLADLRKAKLERDDLRDRVIPIYVDIISGWMCKCGHSMYEHLTPGTECVKCNCTIFRQEPSDE